MPSGPGIDDAAGLGGTGGSIGGLDVTGTAAVAAATGFTGFGFEPSNRGFDFFTTPAFADFAEKAARDSGAEGVAGQKSAIQDVFDRFVEAQKGKTLGTRAAQTLLGAVAPPISLGIAFTDVMRAAGVREESPTAGLPPDLDPFGSSRTASASPFGGGSRSQSTADVSDTSGTNDPGTGPGASAGGSENQTNFGQPASTSPLTGATVTSPTAEEIAAQEEELTAFDAEAFESARLDQIEIERVAREKEAEETSRLRAEEAASNVRSNARPQAASSDPIRLLAPNPDNNDDATTPQQRARFLTSGGPLGLTGTRANVRRPTLFGA